MIASLDEAIREDEEKLVALIAARYEEIRQIDDSLIREILTLREIAGLSWGQIAQKIGGGNSSGSIRTLVWRYRQKKRKTP